MGCGRDACVCVHVCVSVEVIKQYTYKYYRSGKIKLPRYVDYAKTSKNNELAPYDRDWYYVRAGMLYIAPTIRLQVLCGVEFDYWGMYSNTVCIFSASVVRHIYLRRGVGVGGLRKVYGGKDIVIVMYTLN